MEERYASHTHSGSNILQTDLSATHVLQYELLYIAHQLLIHDVVHGVVANSVVVIVFGQHVDLLWLGGNLHLVDVFLRLRSFRLFLFRSHISTLKLFKTHGGSSHAGILTFQHTRFLTFDDVLVNLNRSKTHHLVETHDGFLYVERLSKVVVSSQCDVQVVHGLWCQHGVSHQHKLGLVLAMAGLELVA